uniref:Piezo-type mechanosensitive ion channel component n=1 Tax=Plectus sambesii TaxID=2011161 RepID=A0A914VZT2_9BILA
MFGLLLMGKYTPLAFLFYNVAAVLRPSVLGIGYVCLALWSFRGSLTLPAALGVTVGAIVLLVIQLIVFALDATLHLSALSCGNNYRLLVQAVGIYRLGDTSKFSWQLMVGAGRVFGAELIVVVAAILGVYTAPEASGTRRVSGRSAGQDDDEDRVARRKQSGWTTRRAFVLLLLCATAITHPSLLNLPYFISFIIFLTFLCFDAPSKRPLLNGFTHRLTVLAKRVRVFYVGAHLLLQYSYQIPYLQAQIPDKVARYLGLIKFFCDGCTVDPETGQLALEQGIYWAKYASPVLLLLLFAAFWWKTDCMHWCRPSRSSSTGVEEIIEGVELQPTNALRSGLKSASSPLLNTSMSMVVREDLPLPDEDEASVSDEDSSDDHDDLDTRKLNKNPPIVDKETADCFALLFITFYSLLHAIVMWPVKHKAFFMEHSYLLIPVCIMAWAVLFPSWLSFVWVVASWGIFSFIGERRRRIQISPFMVGYAAILLIVQYICALDLIRFGEQPWDRIGFDNVSDAAAFHCLLIKVIFSLSFFLTRFLDGRAVSGTVDVEPEFSGVCTRKAQDPEGGTERSLESERVPLNAANGRANVDEEQQQQQPGQVTLFFDDWAAPFICLFSCILYVCFYYLYFLIYDDPVTMDEYEWVSSEAKNLASALWLPTLFIFFLIVVHLKRFHVLGDATRRRRPVVIAPRSTTTPDRPTQADWIEFAFYLVKDRLELLLDSVVYDHMWKFVALGLTLLAVFEVAFVLSGAMILVVLMIVSPKTHRYCSIAASTLLGTLWLARFVVSRARLAARQPGCNVLLFDSFNNDLADWIGLEQDRPSWPIILVLFLISLQAIVMHKGRLVRREIFDDVRREMADLSWRNGVRFLLKFFFHKFGLEVCLLTSVIVAAIRQDSFGLIYLVAVVLFRFTPRPFIARVWRSYGYFLALAFIWQYLVCVGLPKEWIDCNGYPWQNWPININIWLYLPDERSITTPSPYLLIGDFFQLLFVWSQMAVFTRDRFYKGGDNRPVLEIMKEKKKNRESIYIPAEYTDFISEESSSMAYMKSGVFLYSHWVTLIIVLISGIDGGSIFAFGYLLASFTLLWMGTDLYATKSLARFLHRWRYLVGYNLFVLLVKALYMGAVCHFGLMIQCWLQKLLSIGCSPELLRNVVPLNGEGASVFAAMGASQNLSETELLGSPIESCDPKAGLIGSDTERWRRFESTMIYDIVCFAALLFQMRIFNSWYFQHVVVDYRADRVLGCRGADLTDDLNIRESRQNEKRVRREFEEIKRNIAKEDEDRPNKSEPDPLTHEELKRWGTYYMMSEKFFPKSSQPRISPPVSRQISRDPSVTMSMPAMCLDRPNSSSVEHEPRRTLSTSQMGIPPIDGAEIVPPPPPPVRTVDDSTMVEKTVEVFDSVKITFGHLFELLKNPEWLYRNSKGHAFIAHVLEEEKKNLKTTFGQQLLMAESREELRKIRASYERYKERTACDRPISRDSTNTISTSQRLWDEAIMEWRNLHTLVKIVYAGSYWVMAQSETLCFLLMICVHMSKSALITLPLPFMVFFWGALCIPRPPKTFWIINIVYIELMIVLRLFFQHHIFIWNAGQRAGVDDPFWPPRMLGTDPSVHGTYWDVALLSMLFIHRYKLFRLGLWSESRVSVVRKYRRRRDFSECPPGSVGYRRTMSIDGRKKSSVIMRPAPRRGSFQIESPPPTGSSRFMLRRQLSTPMELDREEEPPDPAPGPIVATSSKLKRKKSVREKIRPWSEYSSVFMYLRKLFEDKAPTSHDWYAWMVMCDAICLILLTVFYSMLGQGGTGNVLNDVRASRLPRWFAFTLPALFAMMIIDRWLYLSKKIRFRLVFYSVLTVLLHLIIFFFLPSVTGRSVTWNVVAMALYFVKCLYLLMCAWHIRHGYPSISNEDILRKNYGICRLMMLKIYLNVPFLFELRSAMDWTFTGTAMTVGDWIRLENYYNQFFAQNCWIRYDHWFDAYFPTKRGEPTPTSGKFFKGVLSIMALILIIMAPILCFAFLNSFGARLPPDKMECTVNIQGYPMLYKMEAQFDDLHALDERRRIVLEEKFRAHSLMDDRRSALSFLSDYSEKDVYVAIFPPDSLIDWPVSIPGRKKLISELQTPYFPIKVIIELKLYRQREKNTNDARVHRWTRAIDVNVDGVTEGEIREMRQFRQNLVNMINASNHEDQVDTYALINLKVPPYFLAPPEGDLVDARPMTAAVEYDHQEIRARFNLVNMSPRPDHWRMEMKKDVSSAGSHYLFDAPPAEGISNDPERRHVQLIIFVDRVVPSWMAYIVGSGGMVAMYVAVVLVVGRFVRELVKTEVPYSMIENLPNADNVLRLIHDIYLVREKREYYLESRLFGKLLFLLRSPESLVRWSTYHVKRKLD